MTLYITSSKSRLKSLLLIILISLFLDSCKNKNEIIISDKIKTFSKFPRKDNLKFRKLAEYKYGNPRQMVLLDSTIILVNQVRNLEYYLYNYSLTKNFFSRPYIRRGRNSKELVGMPAIGVSGGYLWLNDFTGKKMLLLDKKKVNTNNFKDIVKYSYKTNRNYRSILMDSLRIISTGNNLSKLKIQITDLKTNSTIDEFGKLIHDSKDLTLPIITQSTFSQTLLKPSKDKLVLAYIHTDIVEIFDLKTKKNTTLQGPEKFDIDFKIYKNMWFEDKKTRVAFIGGSVTDKYIYLLYSGKNFSDENAFKGNSIYVYDWDMKPIKKIKINKEVYQICVSKDDKTIYSFDEDSKHIVYTDIN